MLTPCKNEWASLCWAVGPSGLFFSRSERFCLEVALRQLLPGSSVHAHQGLACFSSPHGSLLKCGSVGELPLTDPVTAEMLMPRAEKLLSHCDVDDTCPGERHRVSAQGTLADRVYRDLPAPSFIH